MTITLYELCGADQELVFSPHCWKVRMALAHKGLDYTSVPVPFSKVSTVEGGEKRLVPVLRDGDTVIEDSFAIARYLEDTYPDRPSLFDGDGGKAVTAMIINWTQTQIQTVGMRLVMMNIHDAVAPEDQAHYRATREKRFGKTLEEAHAAFQATTPADLVTALVPLEATLGGQKFIGGDHPLFADYVVFGALQWIRSFRGEGVVAGSPNVSAWFNTLLDMYDAMGRKARLAA